MDHKRYEMKRRFGFSGAATVFFWPKFNPGLLSCDTFTPSRKMSSRQKALRECTGLQKKVYLVVVASRSTRPGFFTFTGRWFNCTSIHLRCKSGLKEPQPLTVRSNQPEHQAGQASSRCASRSPTRGTNSAAEERSVSHSEPNQPKLFLRATESKSNFPTLDRRLWDVSCV